MYGQLAWMNIRRSRTVLDRTFPCSPQQPGSPLATPLYHRLLPQEVEKISPPGKTRPCSSPHDPRTPLHSQSAPMVYIFSLFCSSSVEPDNLEMQRATHPDGQDIGGNIWSWWIGVKAIDKTY